MKLLFFLALFDVGDLVQHIEKISLPREWAKNIDFLAAARLFGINILVSEPIADREKKYRWQIYTPSISESLDVKQDLTKPSIFIRFVNNNHFEIILEPVPYI
jgi:hypothetical protein